MKQKSYSLIDDFNDFDDKKHISLPKSTANIIKELELGTFLYDTFNLSTVDQSKSKELISFLYMRPNRRTNILPKNNKK